MEQRKEAELQEIDVASMGVLLGVVAAAFIALGVIIYFFGEDQSSTHVRRQQSAGTDRADDPQQIRTAGHVGQGSGAQSNSR